MPDSAFEKPPIVDRGFAEKFMVSVDRPLEYGVYFLINDWWDSADQNAIDQYMNELHAIPGAKEFLEEKYIAPTMTLDGLRHCAPGTLGAAYRDFVEENNLFENFARDYRAYYESMISEGRLKRMPEDLAYMSLRATQLHDFMHVLTGYGATIQGELALAAYYLAQMRNPYHSTRLAVTLAHTAFVAPSGTTLVMDAFTDGWTYGRNTQNINFAKWEERLDEPLAALQAEMGLRQIAKAA